MINKIVLAVFLSVFIVSCAQVPKESVELSTTIGRDLTSVHQAHQELAKLMFSRMRSDINRFVDEVYEPFQINNVMKRQRELAMSSDAKDRGKSLLLIINTAFSDTGTSAMQNTALQAMNITVQKIHQDVESMRSELLDPIDQQESEVLSAIDRAYLQLHYANSIVTGYLSSVVKVHNTQSELLESIGVDRDLRAVVGKKLSDASEKINDLVDDATQADAKLSGVEEKVKQLKSTINEFKEKL